MGINRNHTIHPFTSRMAAALISTRKRYEDQVKNAIAKVDDEGFAQRDIHSLKQLLTKLTTSYEKLGDTNAQIGATTTANDADTFMAQYEDQVDEAIVKITRALALFQPIPEPPLHKANEAHPALKSPFDNVGTFNGTHAAWPAFRDLFTALVVKQAYDDTEKFLMLQRACKGDAMRMIEGYQPVATSFSKAWEALAKVYEDKHALTQALIGKMTELQHAQTETTSELRRVIDTFGSAHRQLEAMNYQCDTWDPWLIHTIMRKLPLQTLTDWEQNRKVEKQPTFAEILEYLESRARMRAHTIPAAPHMVPATQNKPEGSRQYRRKQPDELASSSDSKRASDNTRPKCHLCSGNHMLFKCHQLRDEKDLNKRKQIVEGLKVCTNCFSDKHDLSQCPRKACPKCNKGKHNSILCSAPHSANPRHVASVNRKRRQPE